MKRRLPIIKLRGKIRLNIGCGYKEEEGFIGIDKADCEQEILWDVRDGIPFPDNSVDTIWSQHVMEHLTNEEALDVLKEMYRVLKIGGTTVNTMPHASDPTSCYFDHKSFWNEDKIDSLLNLLRSFGVKEIARTGRIAMLRGSIGQQRTKELSRTGGTRKTTLNVVHSKKINE